MKMREFGYQIAPFVRTVGLPTSLTSTLRKHIENVGMTDLFKHHLSNDDNDDG